MEVLQIALGLIAAISALIGGVVLLIKTVNRSVRGERDARLALEKELRADIATEKSERSKAQFKITALEKQRNSDLLEIQELRTQVTTMIAQVGTLQAQVATLQTSLDNEQRARERLEKKNEELEKTNAKLFERNKELQTENKTMREMTALLGIQLSENTKAKPATTLKEI
jgi:chromosome segregation ATPase